MPASLIRLSGVTKIYGKDETELRALDNVDLTIEEGEFVAVMGPSGSGKSTAMNILGCLDTPTSGRYLFEGVDVGRLTRDQRGLLRRHYVGFVFQGFNLLRRTTALENVELPLVYRGLKPSERRARAKLALKRVGLEGRETHTAAELSGGQQQRVAIARALAAEPLLLLADEPTGNLDSQRSREIMALLAAFNRELGLTIVLVTHDAEMASYARRRVQFIDGRIVHDEAQEARPS
jgi:putative ABC transport system ATP-binding protein